MIEFTPTEIQTLAGLIDAGVRQVGVRALTPEALSILSKLQDAANATPPKKDDQLGKPVPDAGAV